MSSEKFGTKKTSIYKWLKYQYRDNEALSDATRRANNKCEYCGRCGTQVHHITPRSKGGEHRLKNLVLLCNECHLKAHNNDYFGRDGLNEEMFQFFTELNRGRTPKTSQEVVKYFELLLQEERRYQKDASSKKYVVFSEGKCKAYNELIEILFDMMELENDN